MIQSPQSSVLSLSLAALVIPSGLVGMAGLLLLGAGIGGRLGYRLGVGGLGGAWLGGWLAVLGLPPSNDLDLWLAGVCGEAGGELVTVAEEGGGGAFLPFPFLSMVAGLSSVAVGLHGWYKPSGVVGSKWSQGREASFWKNHSYWVMMSSTTWARALPAIMSSGSWTASHSHICTGMSMPYIL